MDWLVSFSFLSTPRDAAPGAAIVTRRSKWKADLLKTHGTVMLPFVYYVAVCSGGSAPDFEFWPLSGVGQGMGYVHK